MSDRTIRVDPSGALGLLARSRDVLLQADAALGTAAELVRRDAVALAPKAEGDLHRNIHKGRISFLVHQVIARAGHSSFVERGTGTLGPSGRPYRGMLPRSGVAAIALWIRRKGIVARSVSERSLPWVIARKIARTGTAAQPYMELAAKVNEPRIHALVRAAIERGLQGARA